MLTNIKESKPKRIGPGIAGEQTVKSGIAKSSSRYEIIEKFLNFFFNLCQIPRQKVDSLLLPG